jgi:hypothetical protein
LLERAAEGEGARRFRLHRGVPFDGDKISRLETFHINVGGPGDTLFTAPTG